MEASLRARFEAKFDAVQAQINSKGKVMNMPMEVGPGQGGPLSSVDQSLLQAVHPERIPLLPKYLGIPPDPNLFTMAELEFIVDGNFLATAQPYSQDQKELIAEFLHQFIQGHVVLPDHDHDGVCMGDSMMCQAFNAWPQDTPFLDADANIRMAHMILTMVPVEPWLHYRGMRFEPDGIWCMLLTMLGLPSHWQSYRPALTGMLLGGQTTLKLLGTILRCMPPISKPCHGIPAMLQWRTSPCSNL
jgi:hypothetical protein